MKRSELKNIVKEIIEAEIGQAEIDPATGVKTTLSRVDPETGRREWDVEYPVDPEFLYNKLEDLVKYMSKVEKGSELGQIRDIIKTLKNKTARLIK
jgi:hypothetical protein